MSGRLARDIKQSKPFYSTRLEAFFNLVRTTEALTRDHSHLLKPYDLSRTQYNVLRILRGAGDDGLPCSEIGNRLISHDPDVTRLIDRLERRGLVSRTRETADRRVVTVRITASGAELLAECDLDRRSDELLAVRFDRISADDCKTLITLLENLRDP